MMVGLVWFFKARYSGLLAHILFIRKGFDVQVRIWGMTDWPVGFYHNFSAGSLESPSYMLGYTFARKVAAESHTNASSVIRKRIQSNMPSATC